MRIPNWLRRTVRQVAVVLGIWTGMLVAVMVLRAMVFSDDECNDVIGLASGRMTVQAACVDPD
jgi:hypothetical protein